jgi:flagellar hook capping protein FlgD
LAWVPWGKIDAVPGEEVGRAVVATLDNVATHWAVAAERGPQTTAKEAFDGVEAVATPYELMAETLVESKKAAAQVDGPVFATLTPEALAFVETGVVPRMKSVNVDLSPKTATVEAVRAIDNIAPEPVPYLRAMDTPNDMGSSITVLWTKSESDRMLPRSFSNAIGISLADQVSGVEGYNIYRKVGDGQSSLVGKAGAGETSFQDLTALNGVRYTYQVRPYDADNETGAMFERVGISIRNNAVDVSGQPIYGLFGIDTQVGFDDFFVFADNFGLSAADEIFEPAFDLIANAKIDFDDFFAFADNFGREAVAAGKVVPMMAGLNADARLYLDAGADLPKIGEEVTIDVSLADFVELKGYGFSVDYDADLLEFVKVVTDNSLLGESELAQPTVISQTDGQVAIAAYGETVSEGDLGVSLVFRTKTEIENTYVEVMESNASDVNYAVDPVALPAPVQIQTRPEQYALGNNYPNPFNPATTIKYALPEAGLAKLEVYNVVGQVVRTLVAGQQNAGRYVVQWDASDDSGRSLSSGIYFYRLQAGDEFLEVKKMLLLK